jgi:glycosyltransferase involved in cell wall biosynthesis
MSEPLLTIGYSVLAERARSIRLPDEMDDVEVLVVVQGSPDGGVPDDAPRRHDVRYEVLDSRGVTKSRNAVLDRARGQFVLFADDDIVFHEEGVRSVLRELEEHPDLALVLGIAVDEGGRLRKPYPSRPLRLTRWNSGKAATYEIMLRRSAFARAGVRFDERFGAGVDPHYLGDEYILIADAIRAGLECRFLPVVMAMHPTVSSGAGWGTARDARARAAIFGRVFGPTAPVARLAFVARSPRRFGSAALSARFVLDRF